MEISGTSANLLSTPAGPSSQLTKSGGNDAEVREAFDSFVGETFYGQMLKSLRTMTDKPAYFHGGRAEEIFQNQLDQILSESLSKSSAQGFTGPMFELFQLQRS